MKPERLKNHDFKWVSPENRPSRFPGDEKPVRIGKPENRKPLLWVTRADSKDGLVDLYLINDTGETLDEVIPSHGGFVTTDDEILPTSAEDKAIYKDVQPGEAIKIEEYDVIYDSDFVLSISVQIKSDKLGHLELYTMGVKGGVNEEVLLWDTLEEGKNASKRELK